jgi:hypothetical protein
MSPKSSLLARNIAKFIIIVVGLGIIGILFGLAGALIGGRVLGSDSFGFGALGLALGGILIGYPAGIIVGLILIKKLLHKRGSLLLGILGSVFGAIVTIVVAEPLNLNSNANLVFGVFFLSVPLFCLVGFSLRR